MENLHYNLSEQEFSKSRKILLWVFASFFFLGGTWILIDRLLLGNLAMNATLSIVPFGISLFVGFIGYMATFMKRENFFTIDNDKVEFSFGLFKPIRKLFSWTDIKEIQLPHKEKKVMLVFNDGTSFIINLSWIEKKKSSHIRKHFFYAAKEKNLNIVKVQILPKR